MVKAILFDMDGTLIEVQKSYKEAIVRTVQYFVPTVRREDISKGIKSLRGISNFNNDWDASYYLIKKLSGDAPIVVRDAFWKQMQSVFQSFYLGSTLYKKAYGTNSPIHIEKGLIEQETPLITEETLKNLEEYPMGIVTSRPRFEALYTLSFGFFPKYFSLEHLIALDDAKHEKPHPEPLLKLKEKIKADTYFYVGDTIDDAKAAKLAGCISIIVGGNWGDINIGTINELPRVI